MKTVMRRIVRDTAESYYIKEQDNECREVHRRTGFPNERNIQGITKANHGFFVR